jgi:probable HAF family extracellular repeat protein
MREKSEGDNTMRKMIAKAALAACLAAPAQAQAYTVTDLGSLGGNFVSAFALDERGEVAGRASTSSSPSHAFAFIHGGIIDLGTLPGKNQSRAQGINDRTQVVGFSFSARFAADAHAFLWSRGVLADLHPIISLGGNASFASAINDAGNIAGDATTLGDAEDHAVFLRSGTVLDLGTLGGTSSFCDAVNASDTVVGGSALPGDDVFHAFLWNGGMTDLGTLGGSYSESVAINDSGTVVGFSLLAGDQSQHAFLWREGRLVDLHAPPLPASSAALGINNCGQIVGVASPTIADVFDGNFAVLWDGDRVLDLNSRIPPGSGWQLYRAADINDRGEIVGVGNHNGQIRAFLLTPSGRSIEGFDPGEMPLGNRNRYGKCQAARAYDRGGGRPDGRV